MRRSRIFGTKELVGNLNYLGGALFFIYAFCMLIFPLFDGHWTWDYVQKVWDRWQTLNAAVLAFFASVVALNISGINEDRQREREFVAAKAYLPSTLSSLIGYFKRSANFYQGLWDQDEMQDRALDLPALPQDYREVFSNCIRHAEPLIGEYLSSILVHLQVHNSRMHDLEQRVQDGQVHVGNRYELISLIYKLGELYCLVEQLFPFARSEEAFQLRQLEWENFRNAYGIMDIRVEDAFINEHLNLEAFTRRKLEGPREEREDNDQ